MKRTRVVATPAATVADVDGLEDSAIASWTPAQVKAAFGNNVTPADVSGATNPLLDYQFGKTLGTLSAEPDLDIVDIAQNADDDTLWDIKVSLLAGSTALDIDDGEDTYEVTLELKLHDKP